MESSELWIMILWFKKEEENRKREEDKRKMEQKKNYAAQTREQEKLYVFLVSFTFWCNINRTHIPRSSDRRSQWEKQRDLEIREKMKSAKLADDMNDIREQEKKKWVLDGFMLLSMCKIEQGFGSIRFSARLRKSFPVITKVAPSF